MSPLVALVAILATVAVVVVALLLFRGRLRRSTTVLVCGATGVGKSTLINAFVGRAVTATGIGEPVTRNTMYCPAPQHALAFYDSQGLEVQEASQTYLLLLSDLLRLRYHRRTRLQIDFVLICIQEPQGRLDPAHLEIAGLCEDLLVPYGIAITKSLGDPALAAVARKEFSAACFVRCVRAVGLNLPQLTLPAEGVDELLIEIRRYAAFDPNEARQRRRLSSKTEALAVAAAELAVATTHDAAWIGFTDSVSGLLAMPPSEWQVLRSTLRRQVKKAFIPGFLQRNFWTTFDNSRIDAAVSRRLLPAMLRRFADQSGRLTPSDLATATHEATVHLSDDRPYRRRFSGW